MRDPYSKESARENSRDMAIEAQHHAIVDTLMNDHAALLDWLDAHQLTLGDIIVTDPVSLRSMDAHEALLWCALHEHRTGWIVRQLTQWLLRRPELKAEATLFVDEVRDAP